MTAVAENLVVERTKAPLGRLLRAELRFMLRRPRTLIGLGLLALVPIIATIGLSIAAGEETTTEEGDPALQGLAAIIEGNGLLVPIFVLVIMLVMMLPLFGAMWSADALAGEASTGGLRGLLLAPVSRARLLAVKAFGVATLCLIAVTTVAVVGAVAGVAILGGSNGLLTTSGTTLGIGSAIARIALVVVLVTIQVWAVAAVALAISACTEHPLVVLAATLAGIVVFSVLGNISALDWLHPVLLTTGFDSIADAVRSPMPTDTITEATLRAACYILIGYSLALARLTTKDG
jgi:ABC-2 type transport system permease protein